jgi:hypothetical protein
MLRLFVCGGLGVQTCLIRSSGAIITLAEASSEEVISLLTLLVYLEFKVIVFCVLHAFTLPPPSVVCLSICLFGEESHSRAVCFVSLGVGGGNL